MISRGFDGTLVSEIDPEDILKNLRETKMILSRHGRIDYDSWEAKDVNEMRRALDDLLAIVKLEGEAARSGTG
jgi:hypothetical protein